MTKQLAHCHGILAQGRRVAVYMGVGTADRIESVLCAAGLGHIVTVDIVANAQRPDQIIAHCNVAALTDTIRAHGIENPAIMFLSHRKTAQALQVQTA